MAAASDEALVATVRDYFEAFLLNFSLEHEGGADPTSNVDEAPLPPALSDALVEAVQPIRQPRDAG